VYLGVAVPARSQTVDLTLRRAAGGDLTARGELVRLHGPAVYGLCRRLTPDPEDSYQEIWLKVFVALPGFDPDGAASLRTWIIVIAHRHLVDRHRRRVARGRVVPFDDALPAEAPSADERLAARRRAARLEEALTHLPEPQRRVVVLHHLEGIPLAELAASEGVAVGTIKSRLHRGRGHLARLLGAAP
jgi:RNA polymerase sigma-70 factor, ECF subfamily